MSCLSSFRLAFLDRGSDFLGMESAIVGFLGSKSAVVTFLGMDSAVDVLIFLGEI